jgi:hypothetical protein
MVGDSRELVDKLAYRLTRTDGDDPSHRDASPAEMPQPQGNSPSRSH